MMRCAKPGVLVCLVVVLGAGCTAMQGKKAGKSEAHHKPARPETTPELTPVPTVPPQTPGPAAQNVPLPTRPVKNEASEQAKKAGKQIGPVITHLGIARADGTRIEPRGKESGSDVYDNSIGSGFMLIVEAKPGLSNIEVGRRVMAYDANDVHARPDLEIEVDHDLGDGSKAVCDRRRPDIGGIPAINPPSFAETRHVADALNDLACRFEVFIESSSACTVTKQGDFAFLDPNSQVQFCMIVARAWNFPMGDSLISVRVRDKEGNPGPVKTMILRRTDRPRPGEKKPEPTKTATPSRRKP